MAPATCHDGIVALGLRLDATSMTKMEKIVLRQQLEVMIATSLGAKSPPPSGRIAEPEGSAVINWLLKGSQQNYYVSRKGLGALTKTNPVPHLEFYYFGFQMENNSQKHNFVVARLCEPMRFPDVPRTIITTRPN